MTNYKSGVFLLLVLFALVVVMALRSGGAPGHDRSDVWQRRWVRP